MATAALVKMNGMRTTVAALLVVTMSAATAVAAPIPSRGAAAPKNLQQAVEKRDVATQLERIGRESEVEKLTAADIHQLAANPQQLQAAGGLQAKTWVAIGMVAVFVVALVVLGDDDDEPTPATK
jgi:hypothetical protein